MSNPSLKNPFCNFVVDTTLSSIVYTKLLYQERTKFIFVLIIKATVYLRLTLPYVLNSAASFLCSTFPLNKLSLHQTLWTVLSVLSCIGNECVFKCLILLYETCWWRDCTKFNIYLYIYIYIHITYIDIHIILIAIEAAAFTDISTNFNSSSQMKDTCFFQNLIAYLKQQLTWTVCQLL